MRITSNQVDPCANVAVGATLNPHRHEHVELLRRPCGDSKFGFSRNFPQGTGLTGIGRAPETCDAHARAIFDPRQRMRIDGANRSRPCQQGNMDANGSEVAKVRADRGQCHFNSAPGRRVKPASKTEPILVAPLGARWRPLVTRSIGATLAPCLDQGPLPASGQVSAVMRPCP